VSSCYSDTYVQLRRIDTRSFHFLLRCTRQILFTPTDVRTGKKPTDRTNKRVPLTLLLTRRPRSIIFRLVRDLTYSGPWRLRVPFRSFLNHSWHVRSAIGVDEPPKRSLSNLHGQDSNPGNTYVRVSSRLMLWVSLLSAPKLHRSSSLYFVLIKSDTPGRSPMAGLRINNTDAYH
jgi:hypothetical protein